MADGVLWFVEKVSSFASSINPLFGIISPLVGLLRKGLQEEEAHPMDKEFQGLHSKIEGISAEIQQILQQINIDEVNETFGKYEQYIKHQYTAFNDMVRGVKKDPGSADRHMKDFETVYERDKDNEEAVTKKWSKRAQEIQAKMEEVLGQCKEESPL